MSFLKNLFRGRGRDELDLRGEPAPTVEALAPRIERLIAQLVTKEPVPVDMGPNLLIPSPVLVLDGKGSLVQPASIVPRPFLAYFWTGEGREFVDDPMAASFVAPIAVALWGRPTAWMQLSEIHELYVTEGAAQSAWAGSQEAGTRFLSLLLADIARKCAHGLEYPEILATFGVVRPGVDAARVEAKLSVVRKREAEVLRMALG